MTKKLQKKTTDACPLPPDAFEDAQLPVHELDPSITTLLRIHWRTRDPIYYNRRSASSTVYRFDAPNDEFGVLYASPSFEACMAETLMRGRFRGLDAGAPHLVEERAIVDRCVAVIDLAETRTLRLADLTQPLWQFGFDTQVLSTTDYSAPNQWSAAIHSNLGNLDGIYFRSRFANSASVAIFSDRAELIQRGASIPLLDYPLLPDFLDRFNIGIADPRGNDWQDGDA